MNLESLISKIESGSIPSQREFSVLLHHGSVQDRATGCHQVLRAFLNAQGPPQERLIEIFARRSWELSGYDEAVLPDVISAFSRLNQIEMIRRCYKQIGLRFADEGDISKSLYFFDLWQNAYASFQGLDRFEYDRDILNAIDRLAAPFRRHPDNTWQTPIGRKIRVAFLLRGMAETGAILVKIQLLLAQKRDRTKFEIVICSPESRAIVEMTAAGRENIRLFEEAQCRMIFSEEGIGKASSLIQFAEKIHAESPDILFPATALSTLSHYFICALKPAPLTIAQLQGPQAQFVAPSFDYAIAWLSELVADCPVDCEQVDLAVDLPSRRGDLKKTLPEELDIPAEAKVIYVGGRTQKFQGRPFWKAIDLVLAQNPSAYLLVLGLSRDGVPHLGESVAEENQKRIRFLGWRGNYLDYLNRADLVVDTYPSGGGVILLEAMALGIPFIGFENDEIKIFDQVEWSAIDSRVKNRRLMLARDDWASFTRLCGEVIQSPEMFVDAVEENRAYTVSSFGDADKMTRQIENIFERLLRERSSVWTRPREESVVGQRKDTSILNELLYRQARLENLLELRSRAVGVSEREISLERQLRILQSQQTEVAEHSRYCMMKEAQLKAGWTEYNARLAAQATMIEPESYKTSVRRVLRKVKSIFTPISPAD